MTPSTYRCLALALILSFLAAPAFAGSGNGTPDGASDKSGNGLGNGLPNGAGNGDYNGSAGGKPNGTSHSAMPDIDSDSALSHVPRPLPCLKQRNDPNSAPCGRDPQ